MGPVENPLRGEAVGLVLRMQSWRGGCRRGVPCLVRFLRCCGCGVGGDTGFKEERARAWRRCAELLELRDGVKYLYVV